MSIKEKIVIRSKAPTRIDLAGGTLDIWPLYLFLDRAVTINLGIDLFAKAQLDLTPHSNSEGLLIHLRSEDQNAEVRLSWEDVKKGIRVQPQLELHFQLLRFFYFKRIQSGWNDFSFKLTLSTRAQSPAGAGLGGSSTLSIAMLGALASWAAHKDTPTPINPLIMGEDFIEIVRDIETTVIKVPAGLQDYYAAMFGGLQRIHWGTGTHQRSWLDPSIIPELEKRILLFYSGQSRNSGINNWALFKDFIDQKEQTRNRFQTISNATTKLGEHLEKKNWTEVGAAISEEWEIRKTLAAGITTPEIDHAFQEASQLTRLAGKVCGAGGGGCFFVYLTDHQIDALSDSQAQELRKKIETVFISHGMRILNFRGAPQGLEVQVHHEGV